jgi:hypothetical protein
MIGRCKENENMFYIGVSAGSIIAANNLPNNLGFISCHLDVHCDKGSPCGLLNKIYNVCLSNSQAIWISEGNPEIIQ